MGETWSTMKAFSKRADLTELMDSPCSYEELRGCLRDLARVNRVTRGHRPALQWISKLSRTKQRQTPLHIVDVGCGGGDLLLQIERWASHARVPVRLTGVDLNPNAILAAREFAPAASRVHWVVGDAYSLDTEAHPVDIVVSSLFTHHLSDEQIVKFLRWMETVALRGWLINDLYRSRVAYLGFKALAGIARWHRFVRFDGPVSIRRGFLPSEWRSYVASAGIFPLSVDFDVRWPARIYIGRVKQS